MSKPTSTGSAKSFASRSLVKKPAQITPAAKPSAKPAEKAPATVSAKPAKTSAPAAAKKPVAKPTPVKPQPKIPAKPAVKPAAKPVAEKAAKKPKHSFSQKDLDNFRKDMLAMRNLLQTKASNMRTDALTRHDEINPEEDGTDIIERLKDLQLVNGTEQLIHQIDAALHSIADGTYGVCEMCGELIGKERLQALPFAKTCIECQSKLEQDRPMRSSMHWSDL